VIILDHNIGEDQAELLRRWRIHFKHIGVDVGRPEWDDFQEIRRYLHRQKQATFFTRDFDFFLPQLCHPKYSLIVLGMPIKETAVVIKRFLRHPEFKTKAKRCGKVIRLMPRVISWWEIGAERQQDMLW
jgi:hypothetical protein